MKELPDYLFDLGVRCGIAVDRVQIINQINSYFAFNRKNIVCYWDDETEDFLFTHFNEDNTILKETTINDFSFGTVRRLLYVIRELFRVELARVDWRSVQKILHTVIMVQIVDMDGKRIYTVHNNLEIPYSVPLDRARLPGHYLDSLQIGNVIPVFVRELEFTSDGITIKASPHSVKIPELLLVEAITEEGDAVGYLRCIKRVVGKYSLMAADRYIDKLAIKRVSRMLHERITIRKLSEEEAVDLFEKKRLSLKEIKTKRKRYAKKF
jgi:hypothetical protein